MARHHRIQGQDVPFTAEEEAQWDLQEQEWNNNRPTRKLNEIKRIRNQKLQETDFYALQDVSMSNEMKTWRQSLRDIPANHTTEEAYDLLLARDPNTKELTHSVWSKP